MVFGRRWGILRCLLVAAVFALTGCGSSTPAPSDPGSTPSAHSNRDVCTRMLDFFHTTLGVAEAQVAELSQGTINATIGMTGSCYLNLKPRAPYVAWMTLRNMRKPDHTDPEGGRYHRLDGYDEEVWRSADDSFLTRIGTWEGMIAIDDKIASTSSVPLKMTDAKVRDTITFLIAATRELQ
ncbi:hypothetical protein ACFXO9_04305 [Nocardia tengchongensis]|uniref:hypothetical protein n=1 Tax=Nocardia tengchongensis TaxID=2055889 RepID=UPI0036B15F8D